MSTLCPPQSGLFLFILGLTMEVRMIFKDKEVINLLKAIERKLDIVIAMKKSDKIKQASRNIKKGE